ncbi:MAG: hypothetical protein B5M56_03335 [Desulfococcus sp. 4484_241]|nr:MAG: hypothetical protein B5M56_03335 [Desulfococcus sp. 4484_241]
MSDSNCKTIQEINKNVKWAEWSHYQRPLSQRAIHAKVLRILRRKHPGKLLEIGACNDLLLKECQKMGWDVVGLDLSENTSELIVQHDATEPLPFPEKFDCIVALEVIEHLVDTDTFLENMADGLKPGGVLILSTPNLLFWINRLLMFFGQKPKICYEDYHVRMFVWKDLKQRLEKRFAILKVFGSHVLVGPWYANWAKIFSWLGDYLPTISAHFIVVAQKQPETHSIHSTDKALS